MLYKDDHQMYKLEIYGVDRSVYYYPFISRSSHQVEDLNDLVDVLVRFLAFAECFLEDVDNTKKYISHIDLFHAVNLNSLNGDNMLTPVYSKCIIYHYNKDYRLTTNIDFFRKYRPEIVEFLEKVEEIRNSDEMKRIVFELKLFEFENMSASQFKDISYLIDGRIDENDD